MSRGILTASLLALSAALAAPGAWAFCRTTTCDPSDPAQNCEVSPEMCTLTGFPLQWRSSCVTIAVQQDGCSKFGFSAEQVSGVITQAFGSWMSSTCQSGGHPSINVELAGTVECATSEYNSNRANANIVFFTQDEWTHQGLGNALAVTTTRFDTKTGDLWDADMEINAANETLSIGDPITGADLLTILTHEGGHFLGLSHSYVPGATMNPVYSPESDGDSFRSLEADDVAGICAAYPPGRAVATNSCENRHGFSGQCGKDQPAPQEDSKGCSLNMRAANRSHTFASTLSGLMLLGAVFARRLAWRKRLS